jgi:hypothetical protein
MVREQAAQKRAVRGYTKVNRGNEKWREEELAKKAKEDERKVIAIKLLKLLQILVA